MYFYFSHLNVSHNSVKQMLFFILGQNKIFFSIIFISGGSQYLEFDICFHIEDETTISSESFDRFHRMIYVRFSNSTCSVRVKMYQCSNGYQFTRLNLGNIFTCPLKCHPSFDPSVNVIKSTII